MKKRYWQENIVLVFILVIIVVSFFLIKKFWLNVLTGQPGKLGSEQVRQISEGAKRITKEDFNITLFKQEQYKNLKEFISWPPAVIDNRGNPEPFKELFSLNE